MSEEKPPEKQPVRLEDLKPEFDDPAMNEAAQLSVGELRRVRSDPSDPRQEAARKVIEHFDQQLRDAGVGISPALAGTFERIRHLTAKPLIKFPQHSLTRPIEPKSYRLRSPKSPIDDETREALARSNEEAAAAQAQRDEYMRLTAEGITEVAGQLAAESGRSADRHAQAEKDSRRSWWMEIAILAVTILALVVAVIALFR